MGDDEDIALALQLHDDRLQPLHQVLVRLWGEVGRLLGGRAQAGSRGSGCVQSKEATAPSSPAGFPPRASATACRLLTPQPWKLLRIFRPFEGNSQPEETMSKRENLHSTCGFFLPRIKGQSIRPQGAPGGLLSLSHSFDLPSSHTSLDCEAT